MRIRNRFSPWFDLDLAELLHLNNSIWQIARHTHTQADWLSFRQIRNKCTEAIQKAKVSYFKEQFSLCGSNAKKFWKRLKTWRINPPPHSCPCPLMLMMWLLLTRSTWLSSLIATSLCLDSYLTLTCLLAHSRFPHLPPLLM